MSNTSKIIGINVYAINTNNASDPIDLFTSFPAEDNIFSRKKYLIKSIESGSWKEWAGSERRGLIQTAIDNGWRVGVRLAMFETGIELTPKA